MSNMGYCRFENTAADLADCAGACAEYGLPESRSELMALRDMLVDCQRLIEAVNVDELEAAIANKRLK